MSLLSEANFSSHLTSIAARWDTAMEATQHSAAVVCAGTNTNYFLDDQAPPYRPNPHFAQWVPSTATEHCELIVQPGQEPLLLFYQPADYWHMTPSVPEWASKNFHVEQHSTLDSLANSRNARIKGLNKVAWLSPDEPAAGDLVANPTDLIAHLDFLRSEKTAFEIAAIREATRRSVAGHLAARDAFYDGASEYQMYMSFLMATGNTAAELPYSSIVALNEHAGVLHYQYYDRHTPPAHLSFLIDAGASHLGYASDITRTYSSAQQSIGGKSAPGEFAALIDALDLAQLELIDSIRVDQPYADLHGAMIDRIASLLCEHNILMCSADEAIAKRHADPFMPHGLGHLIGLQTHDVGGHIADTKGTPAPPDERFPALRLTRPMQAHSVFTIEPGIYFIPLLLDELRNTTAPLNWSLIDALLPCGGIRIEDNIWLTDQGAVNLTREAFHAAI